MIRDMSKSQFLAALERHGMKNAGFMGYVEIGIEGHRISVCRFNAGKNLRAQLAYLIKSKERWQERIDEENATKQTSAPVSNSERKLA